MSSNSSDSPPPRPGGFQAVRSWLRGMVESLKPSEAAPPEEEILPTWDAAAPAPPPVEAAPTAAPAVAAPVAEAPPPEAVVPAAIPLAEVVSAAPEISAPPAAEPAAPAPPEPAPPPLPPCPVCDVPRSAGQSYCDSCGYMFPPERPPSAAPAAPTVVTRLAGRYELGQRLADRCGVERFRGLDHSSAPPRPVVIVRAPLPPVAEPLLPLATTTETSDEMAISFDPAESAASSVTSQIVPGPPWPTIAWERNLLQTAQHPFLPAVLDTFTEDGLEYLVEELPTGQSLWDAWDDPSATAEMRFGWLKHIAEQLRALHLAGAMPESLRPDVVVVTGDGRARLADLSELLPLPLPPDAPIHSSLYTAPELAACSGKADARANLYSFGAMLYALHVGRELTETDFERPGHPKPFLPHFPDAHPAFGRLMMKTFSRDPAARFPTDEALKEDPSGFTELIRTLESCARTLDTVRLEIAAWTTTGMVRSGNEDAFALLHACESRQDDVGEAALVLLADGMGGYEAGEVAAALAIQYLRRYLLQQKPFAALAGSSMFATEVPRAEGNPPLRADVEEVKRLIQAALKEANRQVYTASRSGVGRRGMGCTAEVVYVDGRSVVVGHVGDSRTYHLSEGRLIQLTRDQTLVNRLVELGTLTAEEAESHPRRNELQQAIGGQPDVEPGLYHGVLKPGDWVLICSDGLPNHVKDRDLKQMLLGEAVSAEMAARRLVNLVNIEGATDNATVVVIRAT